MAARQDRERARKFWAGLDPVARWELGDALVLGDFDWRDWLTVRPSAAFLAELDACRISWELSR